MPFGAPGGNLQPQGMLQVFLNHVVCGMSVQEAVEAPRFVTHSFPGSFEPHPYYPGRLDLERGVGAATGEAIERLGHAVQWLPDLSIATAGVCAIVADRESGILYGGADPRRAARAMGWERGPRRRDGTRTRPPAGHVQTVLGTIAPDQMGVTLPHEHLLIDFKVMFAEPAV